MTVGSVKKAIAILRHLVGAPPQGVNAIARVVAISPSSCFAILRTLTAEGFLDFDDATKTYRISIVPGQLFSTGAEEAMNGWRTWLEEKVRDLAVTYAVCAGIWHVRDDRLELLHVADSPLDTRVQLSVGQRLPVHVGAMGRCIAAHEKLSDDELAAIVTGLRWQSPPAIADYASDVRAAARDGWAVDRDHYIRGVTTLGTAIADDQGVPTYCLNATSFSSQFDDASIVALGEKLGQLGRVAEARLPGANAVRAQGRAFTPVPEPAQ